MGPKLYVDARTVDPHAPGVRNFAPAASGPGQAGGGIEVVQDIPYCFGRYTLSAEAVEPARRGVVFRPVRAKEQAMSLAMPALSAETREALDEVISRYRGHPGALLTILERVQEAHDRNYLPRPTLEYVVTSLGLPLSQIQSVATFYAFFNLEPQGLHTVAICRGTACHTRGSKELLDLLRNTLDFDVSEAEGDKSAWTTRDGAVTLRTVACIGQCALAPVVELDRRIQGHMNDRRLKAAMAELPEEGG